MGKTRSFTIPLVMPGMSAMPRAKSSGALLARQPSQDGEGAREGERGGERERERSKHLLFLSSDSFRQKAVLLRASSFSLSFSRFEFIGASIPSRGLRGS